MDAKAQVLPLISAASALAVQNAILYQARITTMATAAIAAAAAKAASGQLQYLRVIPPATEAMSDAGIHVGQVGAIAPTLPAAFA
ncbi:MAG: hypothetical protein KC431_25695 [Myxococcales bacterium]|nr:hypothetical protein [Myxococcales bacterium]MCA9700945.1 hypothetical protein [Myxococcales bacterium]